jgi:hypothetical protein
MRGIIDTNREACSVSDNNEGRPAGTGPLDLPKLDYPAVTSNVDAARLFVRHLLEAATYMVDSREWQPEDLMEVFRFAKEGGPNPNDFLDGRHFRRRLEEAAQRAERYGEKFSVMFVHLPRTDSPEFLYDAVLDGLLERLRRTDQIFLFKSSFGIHLPYTTAGDLPTLSDRIAELVLAVLNHEVELEIDHIAFPEQVDTTVAMLDWVDETLEANSPSRPVPPPQ